MSKTKRLTVAQLQSLTQNASERWLSPVLVAFAIAYMRLISVFLNAFDVSALNFVSLALYRAGAVLALAVFVSGAVNRLAKKPECKPSGAYSGVLCGLYAWLIVSCVFAALSGGDVIKSYNKKALFDFAISAFVFFPFARVQAASGNGEKPLHVVFHVIAVISTVTALIVLVLLALGESTYTINNAGAITDMRCNPFAASIYIKESRLYINCHPNTTGANAAIVLTICAYMAFAVKRRITKAAYSFAALIQYIILALSNSQTSIIAAACALGYMAFTLVYTCLRRKKTFVRALLGLMPLICTYLTAYYGCRVVFGAYNALLSLSGDLIVPASVEGFNFGFTGRLDIWKTAFISMTSSAENFFFGSTPGGVIKTIIRFSNGALKFYTHNQVFEVGVALGVPAMLAFVWWLAILARDSLRVSFASDESSPFARKLLPAILLTAVVGNTMEAILLF